VIDRLALVLQRTLEGAFPALGQRIGFQPPDDAWRQRVGAGTGVWLNCALVDLREDRLRRQPGVHVQGDPPRRVTAPFLLRCHYLLSAWNSAKDSPAVDASAQEHRLLGDVTALFVDLALLTPARVLVPAELETLPPAWQEVDLDLDLLPAEGYPKLSEFWKTMGRTPLRPVIWLTVTVPVVSAPAPVDGVVTTLITSFGAGREPARPDVAEQLVEVGGVVRDGAGAHAGQPVPVPDALVTLTDPDGRLQARATTGPDGRFVLQDVRPGDYLVQARAPALPVPEASPVRVPSPDAGPLELTFS
jgi:hypothetical protein